MGVSLACTTCGCLVGENGHGFILLLISPSLPVYTTEYYVEWLPLSDFWVAPHPILHRDWLL